MRLLVITQYFWPEDFRINELVNYLCQNGHDVSIITGQPNYPEGRIFSDFLKEPDNYKEFLTAKVVRVRVPARGKTKFSLILNYLSFVVLASIRSLIFCKRNKFDHIFVFEPSPITVCLPAIVTKKFYKIPITFWVLDLWPETLTAVGAIKHNSIFLRPLKGLTKFIYKNCDLILGQSRSFVKEIEKYFPKNSNVKYFPNWVESTYIEDMGHNEVITNNPEIFKIVFAGNIGSAQDFPSILNSMSKLPENSKAVLYVLGDGRYKDWLAKEIISRKLSHRIKLLGRYPQSFMPGCFRAADALLVSLKSDYIFEKTIPGKLQSYMISKKPILGSINGEGAELIKDTFCGLVNNEINQLTLEQNIYELERLSEAERSQMGINGYEYAIKNFNKEILMGKLISWMDTI